MIPEVTQLRDIHGLDGIPWWPLAPGWWLLLGLLVAAVVLIWTLRMPLRLYVPIPVFTLGSWRLDAARQLRELRRRSNQQPFKTSIGELSELLRRIAMARHGRDACAGLTGDDWLEWLRQNDPAGFDWVRDGRALVDGPYAPQSGEDRSGEFKRLIAAAYEWVAAKDEDAPADGRDQAAAKPQEVERGPGA